VSQICGGSVGCSDPFDRETERAFDTFHQRFPYELDLGLDLDLDLDLGLDLGLGSGLVSDLGLLSIGPVVGLSLYSSPLGIPLDRSSCSIYEPSQWDLSCHIVPCRSSSLSKSQ